MSNIAARQQQNLLQQPTNRRSGPLILFVIVGPKRYPKQGPKLDPNQAPKWNPGPQISTEAQTKST